MNNLLIICGPTATGKTSLGVFLAQKFNGEIVSADSRQVYRGMDIGTGKDLPVNSKFRIMPRPIRRRSGCFEAGGNDELGMKDKKYKLGYYLLDQIPVWLYDLVKPNYRFSVADYIECASLVVKNIWRRGRLPILVGGTGFYIKGLIDGIDSLGMGPDWDLRKKLGNLDIKKLGEKLRKVNREKWRQMNKSDRQNPRRLVRTIEIATWAQTVKRKPQSAIWRTRVKDFLIVGLKAPNEVLYQRIDRRVDQRVKEGIVEEIRKLLDKGYDWNNSVLGTTLGYREWRNYFEKKSAKKEVIQRWKFDEHNYARRQMTWFKRDSRINWTDITKPGWKKMVELLVGRWYNFS